MKNGLYNRLGYSHRFVLWIYIADVCYHLYLSVHDTGRSQQLINYTTP